MDTNQTSRGPDAASRQSIPVENRGAAAWTTARATRFARNAAFSLAATTLLTTSLTCRFLSLDRLPGINGDEAWYGVQVLRLIHGHDWSARTPTGLPINPLLFATEWFLLQFHSPNFWLLRLPIALWSLVGLAATYALYRWVYRDSRQAIALVCLTACLPAHLAYSRFCWDGSFAFVSLPLFVFPLLRVLDGRRGKWELGLLSLGAALTVWVHATHALLLIAGLAAWCWQYHRQCLAFIERRPLCCLAVLVACTLLWVKAVDESQFMKGLSDSIASSVARLPQHLAGISDVLLGPRVYQYLAGQPTPDGMPGYRIALLLVLAGPFIGLLRSARPADRGLAVLSLTAFVLVLLAGKTLRLHRLSYERYVLYLVPLMALMALRGSAIWRSPTMRSAATSICLGLSLLGLVQFYNGYFRPLYNQSYRKQLHATFRTGAVEPKAAAAAILQQELARDDRIRIYAEDWWLQHAIDYLLDARHAVPSSVAPERIATPALVVTFTGSAYSKAVIELAHRLHPLSRVMPVDAEHDEPVVTVISLTPGAIADGPPDRPDPPEK